MKYFWIVFAFLFLAACSTSAPTDAEQQQTLEDAVQELPQETQQDIEEEVDIEENTIRDDTDGDGENDIEVTIDEEGVTDVVVELDEEALADVPPMSEYCIAGEFYTYEETEGSVDATIIGIETYKGAQYCKATATSVVESPIGDITTDVVYWFDLEKEEFWITTTTTGAGIPAQSNEIHLIGGEVQ